MRRRCWLSGATAGALFLLSRRARAWVPPSDFLLQKLADRRKSVKTLQFSGVRTYVGRQFEGGKQDVAESFWSGPEGAYRVERRTPKGEYVEVSDGKRRVSVTDGSVAVVESDSRPLERLLLTGGGTREELTRGVEAFGIRKEIASLGRLEDRVCWIVGAKEGDVSSPQLWIDKDRNLPLLLDDPRSKRRVRFDGWGENAGAGVLPARVSWFKGGDVEQELRIQETKVNPKLGTNLFLPDAPIPPATPAPTPKPSPTPKPAASPKPAGTPRKKSPRGARPAATPR